MGEWDRATEGIAVRTSGGSFSINTETLIATQQAFPRSRQGWCHEAELLKNKYKNKYNKYNEQKNIISKGLQYFDSFAKKKKEFSTPLGPDLFYPLVEKAINFLLISGEKEATVEQI